MDQSLIEQVVARVVQKVNESKGASAGECAVCSTDTGAGNPGLLILTQEHGEHCHQLLESARLRERYATCCALTADYQCDLSGVDTVILYEFTIDAMSKIASGICDTPYSRRIPMASRSVSDGWVCTRSGNTPDLARSTSATVDSTVEPSSRERRNP